MVAKLTGEILDTGPAKWSSNLSGAHTVHLHVFKTVPWRSTMRRMNPNRDEQLSASPGGDIRWCGNDTSVTPPCPWPCASLHWSRFFFSDGERWLSLPETVAGVSECFWCHDDDPRATLSLCWNHGTVNDCSNMTLVYGSVFWFI